MGKFVETLPQQIILLPINDNVNDYAKNINENLSNLGYRSIMDNRIEKISKKITDAEIKKIPYMIIIGDKEMESNTLSIRKKSEGDIGKMTLKQLLKHLEDDLSLNIN